MSIVLRASGVDLDVDLCMSWLPSDRVDAKWKAGEIVGRSVASTAGFSALLADDTNEASLVLAQKLLQDFSAPLLELARNNVSTEVDVALFVAGMCSVRFPPDFLTAIAAAGAALRISGYPTTDGG